MASSQAYLHEDAGGQLVGESISFAVLTTVFLGLRYYARRFTGSKFGLDDVFLLVAYVLNLGMCTLGIVMVRIGGVGQHIEFIKATNPELIQKWAQCLLGFEIIYFSSVAFPKLAILCLYLRIFNWKGGMRWAALALIAIVAATGLSLVLTACFQCTPIAFWWDRTIPGGKCIDVQLFFHVSSIPQFVLDFFIMALPIKTIWDLKLPTHKRIALLFIFLVASFGVVASIIRAKTFFSTSAFTDETFASVELVGWSIIETGIYIIAACMPHLRPLFAHWTPLWIREKVRMTLSHATSSLSKSKSRRHAEDEIELTGSTKVRSTTARTKSIIAGWGSNDLSKCSASSQSPKSTKVDVRQSNGIMDYREWKEDDGTEIKVTNEIKVESSPVEDGRYNKGNFI